MLTREDAYDVAGQVLELPLDAIEPDPANPRDDLGDLDGLAASIREVGVIEPVVVTPLSDDRFRLLAGERRHAASRLAGCMTIPALVRPEIDSRHRLIAAVIENLQRKELAPLEEAKAYARLVDEFDLSQDEIAAKVGCSQAHVSKRLALLDLPDRAKQALRAGDLGVGDAYQLSRLAAHPERIDEILATDDPEDRRREIEFHVDEVERLDKIAAARAALEAKGLRTVDDEGVQPKHYTPIARNVWSVGLRVDVKKHRTEPCHAVVVRVPWASSKVEQVDVCTDPRRHGPKGDSPLKVPQPDQTRKGASAEEQQRRANEREATNARTAFMRDAVNPERARLPIGQDQLVDIVLRRYVLGGWATVIHRTCQLLDLEPIITSGRAKDWHATLAQFFDGHGRKERLLVALAHVLAEGEELPHQWRDHHRTLLTDLGYTPTDWERTSWDTERAEREVDEAALDAYDALDRVTERVLELDRDDDPRIRTLQDELDEGPSPQRAREIQAALDAIFAELNDLQPGDTVEPDPDTDGHTITRSAAANPQTSHTDAAGAGDGVRTPPLSSYVKPAPKCSVPERFARDRIAVLHELLPDDERLAALQQELYAGVDVARAKEIYLELEQIDRTIPLDDYRTEPTSATEADCRARIATLDPTDPTVAALQQELYRGVDVPRAMTIRKELNRLANAKATTP